MAPSQTLHLPSSPLVLIVDDVAANVEILQNVLESEGFRALTAGDGPTARAISRAEQPDLILLDVVMPGEDGFEACRRLKSDPATADIPIIFLSALDQTKAKVTGLKIGGVDFIAKPFDAEEVLARVRLHLRIRDTNRQIADRYRMALEQLRSAQQAILVNPADYPEANFAVYYEPRNETGGDFYDVVRVDSEVFGYYVADVRSDGISAAFLTSALKALLHQFAGPLFSPEDTMRGIDSVMRQILTDKQYMTACYVRLNSRTRTVSVVSAGHPPVILVGASGNAQMVQMKSDPLGLFSSLVLQRQDFRLSPGDRLLLYTDGLIDDSKQDGMERLMDAGARYRMEPLAEAVSRIVNAVRPESGVVQDDLLLLGVDVVA